MNDVTQMFSGKAGKKSSSVTERTPNFGAEAERSYFFHDLRLKCSKDVLKLHVIAFH